MRWLALGLVGSIVLGCAGAPGPSRPPRTPATPSADAASNTAPAPVVAGPKELPDAAKEFESARVTGTIALFDSQDGSLACSDVKRCQTAVTPASTFKIPHSLVALEAGVVDGPDTVLPWDKQKYWNERWNQDLSFRDAFRVSCLPCYQAIARKVGEAGERDWLGKLGYGNRSVGGGVDQFWMEGGLLISPLEQVDFLRRFDGGKLPVSARSADIVRDMMTLDVTETYVLRGKTGTSGTPQDARMLAWLVGWLEQGDRRVFFATLLDGHAPGVDPMEVRRPLTERILRARGLM